MSSGTVHILMTGGGAPGAAGILRCLKANESFQITIADANPDAVGRYLHLDFVTLPKAADLAFTTELSRVCAERSIDILIPLVTRELIPLAEHYDALRSLGTRPVISPLASLAVANNKSALYRHLDAHGVPVPRFRVVQTVKEFAAAATELGFPGASFCFKPSVSNGSRGFRIVSASFHEPDLVWNEKPDHTFITYNRALTLLSSADFPELLVSEYLPGNEYSVDCLARHGEPVLIVPRLRHRMVRGITVEGEFIRQDAIIDYCATIIRLLQLHGNIGLQVRESAEGRFLLLEINPRLQGTTVACLGAGVNLPVLAVKQELEWTIAPEELHVKWGTRFSRYWTEVFY